MNAKIAGSNGARLSETITNTTPNELWANGTSSAIAVNIQYFASTSEATAFFNNQSFGYTTAPPSYSVSTPNGIAAYKQVTGLTPSIDVEAYKLISFNFASVQANVAIQQDAFVIWGQVTVTGL